MTNSEQLFVEQCEVAGVHLELHPYKSVWYSKEDTLIISDAHLGKADHFRKMGIAIPQKVEITNINRLRELFKYYTPKRVIFLGDLFHSYINAAWKLLEQLITDFSEVVFDLVIGNHDILPEEAYDNCQLRLFDAIELGPFLLTHHPLENCESSKYNLAGHLHPGVVMRGKAKQYLKLPCFYFAKNQGVIPAFGAFTGLYKMSAEEAEQIYIVSQSEVRRVK